ncbi:MAG: cadherin-like beta sandwich domain-containing protein [Chromatiales bacterium]|nr:cadherin-like beta sandwich domain-containing protein [Chromatiales bacterium]
MQGSVEGSDAWVGGLVGLNYGAIINGYAEGSVKGHTSVGGLAGYSLGPISNSYASVDIEAKAYSGGLVGYNHHREDFNYGGRITNSYATGSVQSGFGVGGLVGYNSGGFINDVYASGPVVGSVNVGGLVGYNAANGRINGRIENGYALGVVSGGVSVGGLVGYSDSNAVIINSYWDSDVSGIDISAGGTSRTSVELLTNVELLSSASTTTVYANWSADNWDFGSQASLKYPTLKYRLGTDSYGNQICGADVSLPDCGTALPDQGQPGSLGQLALTTLTLSEGVLEPPFDPTQTYYEILDIPAEQTDVTIAATINNNQATITIDDMPLSGEVTISRNGIGSTLEDGIQIVLTAIDQSTQQYTIVLPTQPVLTGLATSPCREDDIDIDDDGLIEICDIEGLYAMRYQLDGSGYRPSSNANLVTTSCGGGDGNDTCNGYELMRDLDFNNPDHYRESRNQAIWTVADYGDMTDRGWRPIGHPTRPFNAIFTGNGYTISNLAINRDDSDYVGLFGNTASDAEIANVGLSDVTIQGRSLVGGLVGRNNESTIEHSYVSGDVLGHDILVGGLVGWHGGRINNSYVMGMVSGNREVGGLVGTSYSIDNNSTSTIINSYALSNVQGRTFVGGLIGLNVELTSNSYASGGVNGIITVGGLVGLNAGIIENSYASGSSSGDDFIGGLIGDNRVSVRTSYANGAVSGNRFVGGLIGINSGSIVDSYWDRETSGIGTSAGSPDANGLTTNQLQTSNLFDGWSSEQWDVAAGRYPALKYTAGDDNENPTCDNEVETDLPPCGIVLSAQIPGLLDSLTVFGGILTPQFDPQMPSYNVDASIDEIELRATAADSLITVRIDESAEASTNTNSISQTIPILDDRTTTITVVVTAQDGSRTETYTITVHPTTGIRVRVKVFLEGPLR